jgi:UDP-MurNAc hydroxylase
MKIHFYGNACFSIFHNGIHILCDPWLDGPAVAGGWTHFPPCNFKACDIPKPDYIYISHIHSDHCEATTLENLDHNVPVILLERNPNFLEKMLRSKGFPNLILVPEKIPTQITPKLGVEAFGATFDHLSSQFIDSSILFDFGDKIVLNCNDNAPEIDFCNYISRKYPIVNLAFLPAGGGGAYPAMYKNLSDLEKKEAVETTLENYAMLFTTAINIIKPSTVVPVAGGYAIQGPLSESVNWFQPRRFNLMEIVKYYQEHGSENIKIFPLQSGMVLDANKQKILDGKYHIWTENELKKYFTRLNKPKISNSINTSRHLPNLLRILIPARHKLWEKQSQLDQFHTYIIALDIQGENLIHLVNLNHEMIKSVERTENIPEPYIKMSLNQDTLLEWLLGFEDFNMLDSGHRILFERSPNLYLQEAYMLMSFLHL